MRVRTVWRLGIVAAAVAAGTVVGAGPAAAHVTVNPSDAVQGGFTKLSFRVPTESDQLSTVKVEVVVPTDKPIAFMSVKPVPGWNVTAAKTKLATPVKSDDGEVTEAVSKITWTSSGAAAAIKPGQFQEFEVSAGPLPETDQIVFKALQTYSDGSVVRWIEEPAADGTESEHPAPVLKLAKAAGEGPSASPSAQAAPLPKADNSDGEGGWAVGIGIAALVAALGALVLAGLAWRRSAPATPPTEKSAEN